MKVYIYIESESNLWRVQRVGSITVYIYIYIYICIYVERVQPVESTKSWIDNSLYLYIYIYIRRERVQPVESTESCIERESPICGELYIKFV